MKPTTEVGVSVLLGLICSFLSLHYVRFDYNLFSDTFVFWKTVVQIGTPVLFVFLWHCILKAAFRT